MPYVHAVNKCDQQVVINTEEIKSSLSDQVNLSSCPEKSEYSHSSEQLKISCKSNMNIDLVFTQLLAKIFQ